MLRLPGDPALLIMSPDAPPEAIAAFRHAWGLDRPIWVQYLAYFANIAHGDLGQSMRDGRPAIQLVAERIPATLALTIPALALKIGIGIPAGAYAALHRNTATDRAVMALATAGFTVPSFVLGLVLVLVFAVQLRWLPSGGQEGWARAVLPVVTLARPTVTVGGFMVGSLMAGAVVVESVFSWPGVGRLLVVAVSNRDLGVVQCILLLVATTMVGANLLVDLLYGVLDPRLRSVARA